MKFKKYPIPLYCGDFYVIKLDDKELAKTISDLKLVTFAKDFDPKGFDSYAFGEQTPSGFSRYFVFIKDKIKPGVVAHECLHVLKYIFADRGIKISLKNPEPECYLLTWLVNKVHEFLKDDAKLG